MAMLETLTPPKEGRRIEVREGRMVVPDTPIVPFIEGDGTGPDIWRATVRVLDAAVQRAYAGRRRIVWFEVFAGQKARDRFGTWLPEDTLRALEHYTVGIKGPLTTPVGGGFRSLNVALRQQMDLYACVRPSVTSKEYPVRCAIRNVSILSSSARTSKTSMSATSWPAVRPRRNG